MSDDGIPAERHAPSEKSEEASTATLPVEPGDTDTILVLGAQTSSITALNKSTQQWTQLKVELPYVPSGSGVVYDDGNLYLIGGVRNSKAVYKLDRDRKWTRLADMNFGRHPIENNCLVWIGYIWVFGGGDDNGQKRRDGEVYDPKENKWTLLPDVKHCNIIDAVTIWMNTIVVSGRSENNFGLTVECINPNSADWMKLPNIPSIIRKHTLISHGNKLTVLGGFGLLYSSDIVWQFDVESAKWVQLASMKHSAGFLTSVELDNEIYAIGGAQYNGFNPLDRVEIFNGREWREGPSLPRNFENVSATIVPNSFAQILSGDSQ